MKKTIAIALVAAGSALTSLAADKPPAAPASASAPAAAASAAVAVTEEDDDPEPTRSEPELKQAVDEAIARHGPTSSEADRALTELSEYYYFNQRAVDWGKVNERLLVLRRAVHGEVSLPVALTLVNLAASYGINREPARALPLELEALAIREKLLGPEHVDVAFILSNLGRTYRTLDRYAEARAVLLRSLAMSERLRGPDHLFNAFTLSAIGDLYLDAGDSVNGLAAYQRSLAIIEKQPGASVHGSKDRLTSTALGRIADGQITLGDPDSAWLTIQRDLGLAIKSDGAAGPTLRRSLRDNGAIATLRGDYEEAFSLLERSRAMAVQIYGDSHSNLSQTLGSIGILLQRVGDTAGAVRVHRRALEIDLANVGPLHTLVAHRRRLLAGALAEAGDRDGARRELLASLETWTRTFGPDHINVAICHITLAQLAREDDAEAARRHLQIARRVLNAQPAPNGNYVAAADLEDAELSLALGQPADALPVAINGVANAVRAGSPDQQARLLEVIAAASEQLGEAGPALFWRKETVNRIQSFRPGASKAPADLQRQFLASRRPSFVRLAGLLAAAGRLAEAQQAIAMLKEEELGQAVSRAPTADPRSTRMPFPDPAERAADERFRDLMAGLAATAAETNRLRVAARLGEVKADDPAVLAADGDWNRSVEAWTTFAQSARHDLRELADPLRPRAPDPATGDLLTRLDGSALLHYVVTERGVVVLVSTGSSQRAQLLPVAPAELNRRILELRLGIQGRGETLEASRALHRLLVEPVLPDLERAHVRTVLLSLDSSLRYLPFAALTDGRRYLVERFALAIYNPASPSNVTAPAPARLSLVALGSTRGSDELEPLPGVRDELDRIRSGPLPAAVYLDDRFTRQRLMSALAGGDPVVHIASHFSLKPGALAQSYLLLGDGSRLTMQEIRAGAVSFGGVDLLTLSACDTAAGAGVDDTGAEIESFAALAQRLGAHAVLATLWPVVDATTADFMASLYEQRARRGSSKAQALQAAQIAAIRRGAPPYLWAPYVLMGNPR